MIQLETALIVVSLSGVGKTLV